MMSDRTFRAGDRLWLRGQQVTFVEYHRYAAHRIETALIRRNNESEARVVAAWKLAHDRSESLERAKAIPVS